MSTLQRQFVFFVLIVVGTIISIVYLSTSELEELGYLVLFLTVATLLVEEFWEPVYVRTLRWVKRYPWLAWWNLVFYFLSFALGIVMAISTGLAAAVREPLAVPACFIAAVFLRISYRPLWRNGIRWVTRELKEEKERSDKLYRARMAIVQVPYCCVVGFLLFMGFGYFLFTDDLGWGLAFLGMSLLLGVFPLVPYYRAYKNPNFIKQ